MPSLTTLLFVLSLCTCGPATVQAQMAQASNQERSDSISFACPPCNSHCDELRFNQPGNCSHCNMALVPEASLPAPAENGTRIAFYLQSGIEVLDFAGPLEVLSYAGFEVFTVSKTTDPIISQGVLRIIPDYSIANAPQADILAFFGGNGYNTSQDTAVTQWIKDQQNVKLHFSVCTGALLLAEAGILDGLHATTFHNTIDLLENNYPEIRVERASRFVDNGTVISTAGISAGIDGALHLVAKLKGFNMARAVAYNMEYDKWTPGEGLILSNDNPYANLPDQDALNKFAGIYQHPESGEIEVRYNGRDLGLEYYFNQQRFPLYYEEDGQFRDPRGHLVRFLTDVSGAITGYRHEDFPHQQFARLRDNK